MIFSQDCARLFIRRILKECFYKQKMENISREKKQNKTEGFVIKAFLFLSFFLFLTFGSFHLTKFVTADEHYWLYERIPGYWKAIEGMEFKKTLINDKPGVTVALVSGAGLLLERDLANSYRKVIDENLTRYDVNRSERVLFAYRLPILIFSSMFLFFFFWITKKITNSWIALWGVIFIGLSPILIGVSQIINPDAFLWVFSFAAIFSYCAFLKKKRKGYAILVAFFTGLAILSKYTANILFPFYLFLMILYYLMEIKNNTIENVYNYFKKNLLGYLLIVVGAFSTITFFLPAIFIKPIYLYRLTIGFPGGSLLWWAVLIALLMLVIDTFILKNLFLNGLKKIFLKYYLFAKLPILFLFSVLLVLVLGRNFNHDWELFEKIPFDIKNVSDIEMLNVFPNFLELILLELNTFIFSVTPVVLFLIFCLFIKAIFQKSVKFNFLIVAICSFVLIYMVASIKADVINSIRYNIVLYPLISFLAAVGLYGLVPDFAKNLKTNILISFAIIVISTTSLLAAKPYYFNYTCFLLPKDKIIADAWGYGGYEAATYLNSLPDADKLTVWADYYGICEFFKGNCVTDAIIDKNKYLVDYYIITRRGRTRYNPALEINSSSVKAEKYYSKENPIWRLDINNREQNYIKVFRAVSD
jgi:hypothetical protein